MREAISPHPRSTSYKQMHSAAGDGNPEDSDSEDEQEGQLTQDHRIQRLERRLSDLEREVTQLRDGNGAKARPKSRGSKRAILVCFILGSTFWLNCTYTILTVSLPQIAEELNTSTEVAEWVLLGPLLINAMLITAMGKIADTFGRKQTYTIGYTIVAVALLTCGLAPSIEMLILGRAIFGIGQAMTQPSGSGIIMSMYDKHERGTIIGLQSFIGYTAPSIGVLIGGLVVEEYSWRVLFLFPLPLLITCFLGARYFMTGMLEQVEARAQQKLQEAAEAEGKARRMDVEPKTNHQKLLEFDWKGTVALAVTVASVLLFIMQGPKDGWLRPHVLLALAVAAVSLPLLVRIELHAQRPNLAPEFFGDGQILLCVLIFISNAFCYNGLFIVLPYFLSKVQHYSISRASQIMFIRPLCGGIMGPIVGRLTNIDHYCTRATGLVLVGCALSVCTYTSYALFLNKSISVPFLMAILVGQGMAGVTTNVPTNKHIYDRVPDAILSNVTGIRSLLYKIGSMVGMAALMASVQANGGEADDGAYHTATLCTVLASLLGMGAGIALNCLSRREAGARVVREGERVVGGAGMNSSSRGSSSSRGRSSRERGVKGAAREVKRKVLLALTQKKKGGVGRDDGIERARFLDAPDEHEHEHEHERGEGGVQVLMTPRTMSSI